MKCFPAVISDPMSMFISIVNSGSENKTFNVLSGGTGVEEVVDNDLIVNAPDLIGAYNSVNVTSQTFPLFVSEKGLIFSAIVNSFTNSQLTVFDISTTLTTTIDLGAIVSVAVSVQLYYLNGFVYIFGFQSGRTCFIVNASDFSVSVLAVPGIGPLRYGCVDPIRNRVYLCGIGDNILRSIESPTNTLGPTINLSAYGGGGLVNCCLGDSYLVCSVGTAIVVLTPTVAGFTFVNSFAGILSGSIDIAFLAGSFGFAEPGKVNFLKESNLAHTSASLDVRAGFFSTNSKNNQYLFISNQAKTGWTAVDFINYTDYSLISGTDSPDQYPMAVYNPFVDRVVVSDTAVSHAPDFWIISISPSDLSTDIYIPPSLIINGVVSDTSSVIYYPASGADPLFVVLGINSYTAVSVTYNGGKNSSEYINNSLVVMPIIVLKIKFQSSSEEELLNLLTKIRQDSTGTFKSFQIENSVKFNANDRQYLVEFSGDELDDPIFDGTTYLQGVINAMSSLSISIDYLEYNPSMMMNGDCANEDELLIEPQQQVKKTCIFYNRKLI